jgi:hypothetical protein
MFIVLEEPVVLGKKVLRSHSLVPRTRTYITTSNKLCQNLRYPKSRKNFVGMRQHSVDRIRLKPIQERATGSPVYWEIGHFRQVSKRSERLKIPPLGIRRHLWFYLGVIDIHRRNFGTVMLIYSLFMRNTAFDQSWPCLFLDYRSKDGQYT